MTCMRSINIVDRFSCLFVSRPIIALYVYFLLPPRSAVRVVAPQTTWRCKRPDVYSLSWRGIFNRLSLLAMELAGAATKCTRANRGRKAGSAVIGPQIRASQPTAKINNKGNNRRKNNTENTDEKKS